MRKTINLPLSSYEEFVNSELHDFIPNEEQRQVILNTDDVVQVDAGPGSGKTQTIINKIKWLAYCGVKPSKILYITFTKNAAKEALQRLDKNCPGVQCQTIHSFAYSLLIEKKWSTVITEDEENNIFKLYALEKLSVENNTFKNLYDSFNKKDFSDIYNNLTDDDRKKIRTEIFQDKKSCNALSYKDIINEAIDAINHHPKYNKKIFDWIFIDEIQDVDITVINLLKALKNKSEHLVMVGDFNQSIYTNLHGVEPETIQARLDYEFPKKTLLSLTKNYRSADSIIQFSDIIAKGFNKQAITHTSAHENNSEGAICEVETSLYFDEQDFAKRQALNIVASIEIQHEKGVAYHDMAVLYRQFALSSQDSITFSELKKTLEKEHIPYKCVSGNKFSDIITTMRYIYWILSNNKNDNKKAIAIRGIFLGYHGVGAVKAKQIAEMWLSKTPSRYSIVKESVLKIKKLQEQTQGNITAETLINAYTYLFSEEMRLNQEALKQLLPILEKCIEKDNWIENILDIDDDIVKDNCVTISTVHSAKGKEWEIVFIPDAICKTQKFVGYHNTAEDQRIFYVACTRAKNICYIFDTPFRYDSDDLGKHYYPCDFVMMPLLEFKHPIVGFSSYSSFLNTVWCPDLIKELLCKEFHKSIFRFDKVLKCNFIYSYYAFEGELDDREVSVELFLKNFSILENAEDIFKEYLNKSNIDYSDKELIISKDKENNFFNWLCTDWCARREVYGGDLITG